VKLLSEKSVLLMFSDIDNSDETCIHVFINTIC